jgi:hypothetical protein
MTKQNHTTNVYAVFFLVIICLNAHVLQAQDFRPPARGLQVNQPLQLSKKIQCWNGTWGSIIWRA